MLPFEIKGNIRECLEETDLGRNVERNDPKYKGLKKSARDGAPLLDQKKGKSGGTDLCFPTLPLGSRLVRQSAEGRASTTKANGTPNETDLAAGDGVDDGTVRCFGWGGGDSKGTRSLEVCLLHGGGKNYEGGVE